MGIIDKMKNKGAKQSEEVSEDVKKTVTKKAPAKKAVKKSAPKEISAQKDTVSVHGIAHKILLSPVVSEKSTLAEMKHAYTFLVDKNANKIEIKKAIEEVYGVRPLKVRTILVEGKVKRFGRRIGRRSDFKKAIVITSKDQKLSIHEGV